VLEMNLKRFLPKRLRRKKKRNKYRDALDKIKSMTNASQALKELAKLEKELDRDRFKSKLRDEKTFCIMNGSLFILNILITSFVVYITKFSPYQIVNIILAIFHGYMCIRSYLKIKKLIKERVIEEL